MKRIGLVVVSGLVGLTCEDHRLPDVACVASDYELVDIVQGHKGIYTGPPFPLNVLLPPSRSLKRLAALEAKLDYSLIDDKIGQAVNSLRAKGVEKVVVAASSLGVTVALDHAVNHPGAIQALVGWSPIVQPMDRMAGSLSSAPECLSIPILLLVGVEDEVLDDEGLRKLEALRGQPNFDIRYLPEAKHSFFCRKLRRWTPPNPNYHRVAALFALQAAGEFFLKQGA